MKKYLATIKFTQQLLLGISILILLLFPLVLVFMPDLLSEEGILRIYDISHISVFLVMLVRPLADITTDVPWIRPLVILRKGVGVLSASIVVSFIFSKIIVDPWGYLGAFGTIEYWSLTHFALFAHIADITAILLLITSNNFSKKILGVWWKKIQKLSYVFFFASSLYVYLSYGKTSLLFSMVIITIVTVWAFIKNKQRKALSVGCISTICTSKN